jgi:flagellar protein FlbD
MITVTRLNHVPFAVNPDLIERINADPDTTLTMVDGVRYVVTETIEEVIDRISGFRAEVLARAYRLGQPGASDEGS